jgi:hypothetical protein
MISLLQIVVSMLSFVESVVSEALTPIPPTISIPKMIHEPFDVQPIPQR